MKSRLNFNIIDTHDLKTLGIVDTSWYNPDMKIESPTLEVIPPGYLKAVSPFFMEKALNVFDSGNLGITHISCGEGPVDLPDGIWKVKYSICPNDVLFTERYFLKTDRIQCKYDQAFLSLDLSEITTSDQIRKRKLLEEIDLYIQGAVASGNRQNPSLAISLYNKANRMLDSFLNGACNC